MTDPFNIKTLSFINSWFYRIVKSYAIFGGDFVNNDGSGGESIYGMVYRDENFTISHDSKYLLSMVKNKKNIPHTSNS